MDKNKFKKSFEKLIGLLETNKCISHSRYGYKTEKSNKCRAFIADKNPFLSDTYILGIEYVKKRIDAYSQVISHDEFIAFHNEFKKHHFYKLEKAENKFELVIYLEDDMFCLDIRENKVRTKLIEIKMPSEFIGDHNTGTVSNFEKCINNQIKKYLSQKQTNIDIIKSI